MRPDTQQCLGVRFRRSRYDRFPIPTVDLPRLLITAAQRQFWPETVEKRFFFLLQETPQKRTNLGLKGRLGTNKPMNGQNKDTDAQPHAGLSLAQRSGERRCSCQCTAGMALWTRQPTHPPALKSCHQHQSVPPTPTTLMSVCTPRGSDPRPQFASLSHDITSCAPSCTPTPTCVHRLP